MKVIDPGHVYQLQSLDTLPMVEDQDVILTFVKRVGKKYPGNVGPHPGTTMQEVIRALIDRLKYVDNQHPHDANESTILHLRDALMALEFRAAELHGRLQDFKDRFAMDDCPEYLLTCPKCLHIGCEGRCRP